MRFYDRTILPTSRDDLLIQVTDDGSRTLAKVPGNDAFHSGSGAASESHQVYLVNSGVADRLRRNLDSKVLEIGLGTGLAMLLTVDMAIQTQTALRYRALEIDWVDAEILEQLDLARWLNDSELAAGMIQWRQSISSVLPGQCYRWKPADWIEVDVLIEDVTRWQPAADEGYDAVYFDPFCDRSDPQLWTTEIFHKLFTVMKPGGCLTTYACARRIRESISEAGFQCLKTAGPPGGKRETLVAFPAARRDQV